MVGKILILLAALLAVSSASKLSGTLNKKIDPLYEGICELPRNTSNIQLCLDETFGPINIANPRGCNWYFLCQEKFIGEPDLECRCNIGELYHSEERACLPANEVTNCTYNDNRDKAKCEGFGFHRIPSPHGVCNEFTVCFDEKQQDRVCPNITTHYSYFEDECIEPFFANCLEDRICENTTEIFRNMLVANPRDCSSYYVCNNGNFIRRVNCGPGFLFNGTYCIPNDGSVECPDETDFPDIPEKMTYECEQENEGRSIDHPDSCIFWFFCRDFRSSIFVCGEDAVFDTRTKRCAAEAKAVCHLDQQTTVTTEEETTITTDTTEEGTTTTTEQTTTTTSPNPLPNNSTVTPTNPITTETITANPTIAETTTFTNTNSETITPTTPTEIPETVTTTHSIPTTIASTTTNNPTTTEPTIITTDTTTSTISESTTTTTTTRTIPFNTTTSSSSTTASTRIPIITTKSPNFSTLPPLDS